MESCTVEYRGFNILVTPIKDHDDLWDFRYEVTRQGDPEKTAIGHSVARRQTMDGHTTAEAASEAGVKLAKVEVDNYLALRK
jgi:phage tail sheath gpL-like